MANPVPAPSDPEQSTTPPPRAGDAPAMQRMESLGHQPGTMRSSAGDFDIVSMYQSLLRSDAELTMPVAAIESLVALLAATPSLTTISETLDLLNTASATLKRAVPNPISLSAGTDLFTRYIVTSLRPSASQLSTSPHQSALLPSVQGPTPQPSDFQAVRSHLLANGRLFAQRAKAARTRIASLAAPFIRPGTTILTNGGSRVVGAVLRAAAKSQAVHNGSPRFRVVWVTAPASLGLSTHVDAGAARAAEGSATIRELRALGVPVAEVAEAAVAYAMDLVDMALVGAEGVVETGGVISRLGTYQLCTLARNKGRSVYVVAESHKFVRSFPLGQMDLGVEQRVVEFRTSEDDATHAPGSDPSTAKKGSGVSTPASTAATAGTGPGDRTPTASPERNAPFFHPRSQSTSPSTPPLPARAPDAVDYTPPDLITALVTEGGVLTPSAVSEELIRIWY